jgi:ribosomal 30S subunit maturation factor RimM
MKRLFVQRQSFPVLQDDEYYLYDLYNLEVISDLDNISIGRVAAAFDYGAGAFLEIILYANNELTALPFHKDSVISVNLVNKQIKIDRKFLIYNRPT